MQSIYETAWITTTSHLRHCEQSEAIHVLKTAWITASPKATEGFLVMTVFGGGLDSHISFADLQ
jgi:hypothetical protein